MANYHCPVPVASGDVWFTFRFGMHALEDEESPLLPLEVWHLIEKKRRWYKKTCFLRPRSSIKHSFWPFPSISNVSPSLHETPRHASPKALRRLGFPRPGGRAHLRGLPGEAGGKLEENGRIEAGTVNRFWKDLFGDLVNYLNHLTWCVSLD